jgi:4-hydroxy-tetrahydrodipicolinate synthase
MKNLIPQGVYTALVTPFTKNGEVDYPAYKNLLRLQIQAGIQGIVPLGTTGESPSINDDERRKILELSVEEAKGKCIIIAGTGANDTKKALKWTKEAAEIGADFSLQVAPYYNKPNQEGFRRHFLALADEGGMDLMLYNVPGRTGKRVEAETLVELAKHPKIVAVKEASGDMGHFTKILRQLGDLELDLFSGDDGLTYPLLSLGGRGVVSVASNLIPEKMVEMVNWYLSGDHDRSLQHHLGLSEFFEALFYDTNPAPVKFLLSKMGLCEEEFRLPICCTDDQTKTKVLAAARKVGIEL